MCGIVGWMDRSGRTDAPVGRHLLGMLSALGSRGPDSAGVAIFGPQRDGLLLRVSLGETADPERIAREAIARIESAAEVRAEARTGSYLRLELKGAAPLGRVMEAVEGAGAETHGGPEVISAGRRLEIVKQVGSPENLDADYSVSAMTGSHGIGHTRLSTESRVDLSHSQPFWARGLPDVAAVHNGHITNYHQLRRRYEQRGIRFRTENDSEIIGVYLRDRMDRGDALEEALRASMIDLDGSFCYLVATEDTLGYVKDPFGLKPLVVAETAEWVAIATEEIALRRAFGTGFEAREPGIRAIRVWRRTGARQLVAA